MKKLVFLLFLLLVACSSAPTPDEVGFHTLAVARQHLNAKQYDAARDSIFSLRQRNPRALKARAAAILLLDSIEMYAALDSVQTAEGDDQERLNVKAKFFERKLQEDKLRAQE